MMMMMMTGFNWDQVKNKLLLTAAKKYWKSTKKYITAATNMIGLRICTILK